MAQWTVNRRELIVSSLTGALGISLGFSLPIFLEESQALAADEANTLQSFIKIYSDNRIEVVVVKAEMGQGVLTSLAMLLCEDLEAYWPDVTVKLEGEVAPFLDAKAPFGATAGSSSVRSQYQRLRSIGASVRDLLIQAAAQSFDLVPSELYAQDSKIYDKSGQVRCTFGEVARAALYLKAPDNPQLKSADKFKLIGQRIANKDSLEKIEGRAVYGSDVQLPEMEYAAVRHHPSFGSQLSNFSEIAAQVAAPYKIFELPQAIGIVGPSYWQGQKILSALPAVYTAAPEQSEYQQAKLEARLIEAVKDESGDALTSKGDALGRLAESSEKIESIYLVPYLAHSPLEPMCATADVRKDRIDLWIPTQGPGGAVGAVAKALGRDPATIKAHVTFLGGGFGRKIENDAVVQAAILSEKSGKAVKLIWSRQEDTQHDVYRPMFAARLQAGFGAEGLMAWTGKNSGSSILRRSNPKIKIDPTGLEGFTELPYKGIEHLRVQHQEVDLGVPVGFWRSVGRSQNTYFTECFLDEIAAKLGRDPLDYRLEILGDNPRGRSVLETLARVSAWRDSPQRQRLGLAYSEAFGSIAAAVAQVAIENKKVRVEKIFVVVDCGRVINRQGAEAQIQGGAIFGLSAALYGKVTIKDKRVEQSIFAESPFLRIAEAPEVEVTFIDSGAELGGLGEVSTPLIAPAVCNAIFRQSQQMIRKLPIADYVFS